MVHSQMEKKNLTENIFEETWTLFTPDTDFQLTVLKIIKELKETMKGTKANQEQYMKM